MANDPLQRFLDAQEDSYAGALAEIRQGRKRSHWMWFIFPQIAGLGMTETSRFYALKNLGEAHDYLVHPTLGKRLLEISTALLALKEHDAQAVFGSPDDLKLRSCMTLFDAVPGSPDVFGRVLDQFYGGKKDQRTLELLVR